MRVQTFADGVPASVRLTSGAQDVLEKPDKSNLSQIFWIPGCGTPICPPKLG